MRALGATRRAVPTGHVLCELRLDGQTPLLMSSGEVDRESDVFRAYRELSKVRRKSVEQEARLRELEWYTRLYFDERIGCYIPGKNVKELIRDAATNWYKGADVRRSLVVPDYRIPLIYEGPRTTEELWEAGFRYTTMVANAGSARGRVERTRPCFENWALECEIAFDPEDLDLDEIQSFVGRAQKYGLGDYRPEFGAFTATVTEKRVTRANARTNGAKPRDRKLEKAIKEHAKRLTTSV